MSAQHTNSYLAARKKIAPLIDQLMAAIDNPCNQERGKARPQAVFVLEEPIASAHIFEYDVNHYFSDPVFYVEQMLHQKLWRWHNFPGDELPLTPTIPAWLDYYPEFTWVGLDLRFTPEGIPIIQTDHPLTKDPDLKLIPPVDFYQSGWMPRILRWWDALNEICIPPLKINFEMLWWRGCLDLAIQLRGYENFILDVIARPVFVKNLLEYLVAQRCHWYEAFYRHFDLPVQPGIIADDWINVPLISPKIFTDFVLPCYLEIEKFHGKLLSLHSCGNQTLVHQSLLELKSLEIIEISPWSDFDRSLTILPPEKKLQVAVKPNDVLFATQQTMENQLNRIAQGCVGRNFNVNTSGLTPILEDIPAFVRQINHWIEAAQKILAPYRQPLEITDVREGEHHFHTAN